MLSLPYDKIGQATTCFQTMQPLQALSGTVAPWFRQIGGGTQYLLLNGKVDQLLAHVVAVNKINSSSANDAEKAIAKKDYVAAFKVNQAKETAVNYLNKTYGKENDKDGTQVNAYRHVMWNAVMTDKIGEKKAIEYSGQGHDVFSQKIQEAINNGEAMVIS